MQSEAFVLHEIIAWGCLESFSESPITGWMREFTQAIHIKHKIKSNEIDERKSDAIPEAEAARFVSSLLDKEIEKLTMQNFANQLASDK